MPHSKQKLVVLTHSFYPMVGGVETFIEHLLAGLDKRRYDIVVFTADKNIKSYHLKSYTHQEIPVKVIRTVTIGGLIFPISAGALWRLITTLRRADLVHQHDVKFLSTFLVLLGFLFPFRLVLFSHGYMYHSQRFEALKHYFMHYFALLSRRYTRIINVSAPDDAVAHRYAFHNTKFIQEAVDLKAFSRIIKRPEVNRYLYFGRIVSNKGIDQLITCLGTIANRSFSLHLVGNGEAGYIEGLKYKINSVGLGSHVHWHHDASNEALYQQVSAAEVIFMPSLYEGFGISLLEAVASRTLILAHPNDAYYDILTKLNLQNYLFDFGQPQNFAAKLDELVANGPEPSPNLYLFDHQTMVQKIEAAQYGH